MPMLERAAPAASDDPTVAAIATISAALTAAVAEDLAGHGAVEQVAEDRAGDLRPAETLTARPSAGPFGHGKIRLSGRR